MKITHWIAPRPGEPEFAARLISRDGQVYSAAVTTGGRVSACRRLISVGSQSLWRPVRPPPRSLVRLCRERLAPDSEGRRGAE